MIFKNFKLRFYSADKLIFYYVQVFSKQPLADIGFACFTINAFILRILAVHAQKILNVKCEIKKVNRKLAFSFIWKNLILKYYKTWN